MTGLAAGWISPACFGARAYPCDTDEQCDLQAGGRCEETGYCSYLDPSCASGRGYDRLAAPELAGDCLDPAPGSTTSGDEAGDTATTATSNSTEGASTTGNCNVELCEDRDGDGHGVGPDCLLLDCDDDNPAQQDGCRYIAPPPLGSNENPGTREKPWGTFAHAIPELTPGDSLVLLDGTYEVETTGMPVIFCNVDAVDGLGPQMPISVRAENERAAYLASDGSVPAFQMNECSFWNVTGLAGRTDDAPGGAVTTFRVQSSEDIRLRRLTFSHSNRWVKSVLYTIAYSTRVLLEESEGYFYHSIGVQTYRSNELTFRRCYFNAREYENLPGASQRPGAPHASSPSSTGDVAFQLWGGGHRIENCIVDGNHGVGIDLGVPGPNHVVGTIVVDAVTGIIAAADDGSPSTGHTLRDVVVARSNGHQIYLRSATGVVLDGVTLLSGSAVGFAADELTTAPCASLPGGCGFTAQNVLALNNGQFGVRVTGGLQWVISHSNSFDNALGNYNATEVLDDAEGSVQHCTSVPAPEIGFAEDHCAVFVPPGSSMSGKGKDGADIGANVLYRWVDGELTDEPLWDPETHAFPCGERVEDVSDMPGESCYDVHERLNVGANGCELPVDYAMPVPCE